jgi:hypothetical protein
MSAFALACYAVLRLLVPTRGDARISYADLVSQLPEPFCHLNLGNVQDRNVLSAALGEIVQACREHEPPLPPLPAIVVRLVEGEPEYPSYGYFGVAHPGVEGELERLVLWGQDVEAVQRTHYPAAL